MSNPEVASHREGLLRLAAIEIEYNIGNTNPEIEDYIQKLKEFRDLNPHIETNSKKETQAFIEFYFPEKAVEPEKKDIEEELIDIFGELYEEHTEKHPEEKNINIEDIEDENPDEDPDAENPEEIDFIKTEHIEKWEEVEKTLTAEKPVVSEPTEEVLIVAESNEPTEEPVLESNEPTETHEDIPFIGMGIYTAQTLSSWVHVRSSLIERGHSSNACEYIYRTTICQKTDREFIKKRYAIKTLFPDVPAHTAFKMIMDCLLDFTHLLFAGRNTESETPVTEKKVRRVSTRTRKTTQEKIELEARKYLSAYYRRKENLPPRGKLQIDIRDRCEQFIEKNMDKAILSLQKRKAQKESDKETLTHEHSEVGV